MTVARALLERWEGSEGAKVKTAQAPWAALRYVFVMVSPRSTLVPPSVTFSIELDEFREQLGLSLSPSLHN